MPGKPPPYICDTKRMPDECLLFQADNFVHLFHQPSMGPVGCCATLTCDGHHAYAAVPVI
jgi:hypothetical protein